MYSGKLYYSIKCVLYFSRQPAVVPNLIDCKYFLFFRRYNKETQEWYRMGSDPRQIEADRLRAFGYSLRCEQRQKHLLQDRNHSESQVGQELGQSSRQTHLHLVRRVRSLGCEQILQRLLQERRVA